MGVRLPGRGQRLVPRVRVAALAVLAAAVLVALGGHGSASAGSAEKSLAQWLARDGLEVAPDEIVWLEREIDWLGTRQALFVGRHAGQLSDLYYGDVRVAAGGRVAGVHWLTNLTRSSSASEESLVRFGDHVAYAVRVGESYEAVVVLDTRGEPDALTHGWPLRARVQNAISNLQESGRFAGFGRTRFQIDPPARGVRLRARDGKLALNFDGATAVVDPKRPSTDADGARLRRTDVEKGQPGTITWVVDTVRNVSWIGSRPIEWIEHTVFAVADRAQRAFYAVVGADTEAEAREAREALAVPEGPAAEVDALPPRDPAVGLPPPPLAPVLADEVRGEGEWLAVVDTAFVNAYAGAPTAFWQTFLRVDAERTYTRVYFTLWDPRQVQLHVAMGTREPESATGETGTGLIPRAPDLLADLVGGFNGGFQALHGEFGMMADGRVYLPPKPFAATVVVHEDGRVGIGSWPGPERRLWDEAVATRQIPPDVISMRQNLTSVVEDGVYNPWQRWWWGAAPEAAEEQTYIGRSGLCLTREGFLVFVWGESMGPDELGKAMLGARCVRGMHLDMNTKHTGFEWYRPFRGEARPPLGRALAETEFEGPVTGAAGFTFRARLAVTTMAPIRFPRYLARDPRDFFYLTLKRVLPGPDLVVDGAAHAYSTQGLPHADWPPAFARVRLEAPGAWIVRIDARRAIPAPLAPATLDRRLAYLTAAGAAVRAPATGEESLYVRRGRGRQSFSVGVPPGQAKVILSGRVLAETDTQATAAIGVDAEGFLLYVEAEDPAALRAGLAAAGVARAIALDAKNRLAFAAADGSAVAVDGHRPVTVVAGESLAWLAETRPAAEVAYPGVKPMPYRYWGWLQDQRVRYFPKGPPRFPAPDTVQ